MPENLPPVLRAWLEQLITPEMRALIQATEGQIEVRLFANRGKVRKQPTIVLNGGPQELSQVS